MSKTSKMLKFNKLFLDLNNKRYNKIAGPFKTEDEVIDYMLKFENLEDLINSIKKNGYENDEALWVIKNGTKYVVKEGNRRLCALKVLANPTKYRNKVKNLKKYILSNIFCSIYTDEKILDSRIIDRHTQNSIKGWNRLAQAFQIQEEFKKSHDWDKVSGGKSKKTLYKMASFYEKAYPLYPDISKTFACEDEGKSKFEIWDRLFGFDLPETYFGFRFKNYEIEILDKKVFTKFVVHTTKLLSKKGTIVSSDIDKDKIENLLHNHFPSFIAAKGNKKESSSVTSKAAKVQGVTSKNERDKKNQMIMPVLTRANIDEKIKKLVDECYKLDYKKFPNATTAMTRILLEATLKFVVENTKYNGKSYMKKSNHFHNVYYQKGKPRLFMDFSSLHNCFSNLILVTSKRKALEQFEIEKAHQIIHNNAVAALPSDAKVMRENLKHLLEFLLQDETNLLEELDIKKLS